VAFLKLQIKQKITPQKDYKNLDLPILVLETITGRSPHEFSEFWHSHPVRGVSFFLRMMVYKTDLHRRRKAGCWMLD